MSYYDGSGSTYQHVSGASAPNWEEGRYYRAYYGIRRPGMVFYAKWVLNS